jgi:hypothetical protein
MARADREANLANMSAEDTSSPRSEDTFASLISLIEIVTISPCSAKTLPGEWAFEQVTMTAKEREEAALKDGIALTDEL